MKDPKDTRTGCLLLIVGCGLVWAVVFALVRMAT